MSKVKISTSKGDMIAELYDDATPITVKNFTVLIQKGFYKNMVINDEYPLHLCFPKGLLWVHDFISPFVRLVKSNYQLTYLHLDDELSPSEITLQSKAVNRFFKKQLNAISFDICILTSGIASISITNKHQHITLDRIIIN